MEGSPREKRKKRPRPDDQSPTTSFLQNVSTKVLTLLPQTISKWFTSPPSRCNDSTYSSEDEGLEMPAKKRLRVSKTETLCYVPYSEIKMPSNTGAKNVITEDILPSSSNTCHEDITKDFYSNLSEIRARKSILECQFGDVLRDEKHSIYHHLSSKLEKCRRSKLKSGHTTYGGLNASQSNIQHVTNKIVNSHDTNESVAEISSRAQQVMNVFNSTPSPITNKPRVTSRQFGLENYSSPKWSNTRELHVANMASLLTLKRKARLNESTSAARQIMASHSSSLDMEYPEPEPKTKRINANESTSVIDLTTPMDHSTTHVETCTDSLPSTQVAVSEPSSIPNGNVTENICESSSNTVVNDQITSTPMFSFSKPNLNIDVKINTEALTEECQTVQDYPQKDWKCDVCWVNNSSQTNNCVCCSSQRPIEDKYKVKPKEIINVDPFPIVKIPTKWTCPNCWVKNDNSVVECVCCGPIRKEEKKGKVMKKVKTWECPSCFVPNDDNVSQCVCCQTCKSDTNNDHQKIKFNFTLPQTKFKFGIDKQTKKSETVLSPIVPQKLETNTPFSCDIIKPIPEDKRVKENKAKDPMKKFSFTESNETSDRAFEINAVSYKDPVKQSEAVSENTNDDKQEQQAKLPESTENQPEQFSDTSSTVNRTINDKANAIISPEKSPPTPVTFTLRNSSLNINGSTMSDITSSKPTLNVLSTKKDHTQSTPLFSGIKFGVSPDTKAPQSFNKLNAMVPNVNQAPISSQSPILASIQAPSANTTPDEPSVPIQAPVLPPTTAAPTASASTVAPMSFFHANKSLTDSPVANSFFLGVKQDTVTTAASQTSTPIFTFSQSVKSNEEGPRPIFNFGANKAESTSLFTTQNPFTTVNNIEANNNFSGNINGQSGGISMATDGTMNSEVNNGPQMQTTGMFGAGARINSGNDQKPAFNFGSGSSFNTNNKSASSMFGDSSISQTPSHENIFGIPNQNSQPSIFSTPMQNQNVFGSFSVPASGIFGSSNMSQAPSSAFNANPSNSTGNLSSAPVIFGSSNIPQTPTPVFNTNSSSSAATLTSSPVIFGTSNMSQAPSPAFNTNPSNPSPASSVPVMFGSSSISQTPSPAFNTNPSNPSPASSIPVMFGSPSISHAPSPAFNANSSNPTPTFEPTTMNVPRTFNFGATQQLNQPRPMFNFTNQVPSPGGVYNFGQVQFRLGSAPANTTGRRVRKAVRRTLR